MPEEPFDPDRPICRSGIVARELSNGMVYIRHPKFSSRVINRESWGFLQLCDGRNREQLDRAIAELLGFPLTREQIGSSIREFADRGLFKGTIDTSRTYRICDATPVISKISSLVRWLATPWFAVVTLLTFVACLVLLIADWSKFVDSIAWAAREHPAETVLLYYLTFIPIAMLHELGHAAVANFYGGEVPEIVICSNANFAVITNMSVLKNRQARIWYLSMGTVVDVFIWLILLIAFHYLNNYLILIFLLPHTIYFLIYAYSIFKNSDFLKVVCELLNQPVPKSPGKFLLDSWSGSLRQSLQSKLIRVMTLSLAVKLLVTAFLVWTFLLVEPRVLVLYLVYRVLVYAIGHWSIWWRRLFHSNLRVSPTSMKPDAS